MATTPPGAAMNPTSLANGQLGRDALAIKRRGFTLTLLTIAYFFSYMDRQILAILQEDIKAELLLSDTQLGLLAGLAFAIFYATLGLPVARMADRGNRINIIAIALALWSAMTAVCGLAQNFIQLLLARIGVGIGEAGSSPPSHSIIADLYPPEKRAGAMGIYSLGVVLGAAGGTIIGGTLAHYFGWRLAMFAVGVPGIILAIVIKLFVVEPRRGLSDAKTDAADPNDVTQVTAAVAGAGAASGAGTEKMPSLADGFRSLFASRAAVHLVMGVTITSLIGYGHSAFGSSFLIRTLGMTKLEIAYYVAPIGALMGTLSALLGGWLANKAAERYGVYAQSWLVMALKTIGLPLSFVFYLTSDPWVAIPIYWVSLLLVNSYLGPTFALIQGLAPLRMRALWAAVTLLVINLIGLGLGPTLVGVVSDLLTPAYGDKEALRWSMFILAAGTPWALFHYWRAGVWLKRGAA